MGYSVVIPTMGRNTLNRAIESVLAQTVLPEEIIVVAGNTPDLRIGNISKVKIIENFSRDLSIWTAAHNRNLGIKHNSSQYVALLDDDDEWSPDKIEKQLKYLNGNENLVLLTTAVLRYHSGLQKIRPKKIFDTNKPILEELYGKPVFAGSGVYLPTPSIVLSSKLAKSILFDEKLLGYEDTWWLHQLQLGGAALKQLREPLTIVHAEPRRSISRDSVEKNFSWAQRIDSVRHGYGNNFLRGICLRNSILDHKYRDVVYYLKGIHNEC